jgi:hypothetical protein
MSRRRRPDSLTELDLDDLALRDQTIGAVYQYLRERLPEYFWSALDVAVNGWPPHVAFSGSHCEGERFVCLTIDRRVIDCAAAAPDELLHRLDLAQVGAQLDRGDPCRPVSVELD